MDCSNNSRLSIGQKACLLFWILVIPLSLFCTAGTLQWIEAWIVSGLYGAFVVALCVYLQRNDSALLKERLSLPVQQEQPLYDRVFQLLFLPSLFGWMLIPGFDVVRFGWSEAFIWTKAIGCLTFAFCLVLLFFVFASNTFLSPGTKLQREFPFAIRSRFRHAKKDSCETPCESQNARIDCSLCCCRSIRSRQNCSRSARLRLAFFAMASPRQC